METDFSDEDLLIARQIPKDPGSDIHAEQIHEANHSSGCLATGPFRLALMRLPMGSKITYQMSPSLSSKSMRPLPEANARPGIGSQASTGSSKMMDSPRECL